jgi:predicted membrane protein
MEYRSMSRLTPQIVFGISIIIIGVLLTLDNMNFLSAREYLRYWPALLVIFGAVKALQPAGTPGRMFGWILVILGGLLLLDKFDVLEFRIWDYWPIIFIIVGLGLVRGRVFEIFSKREPAQRSTADENMIRAFAFLGGHGLSSNSQDFRGGELTAIMGGCEVDLRRASIKDGEAVLEVFAFWGGIELKVPEDWTVILNAYPILGGFADETRSPKEGPTKKLIVRGYAVMGGVEIKN